MVKFQNLIRIGLLVFINAAHAETHMDALTSKNFRTEVHKAQGEILVFVTARWCGPCKLTEEIFSKLIKEPEMQKIHFLKLDYDAEPALISRLNIGGIPTILIYHDGKLITSSVGYAGTPDGGQAVLAKMKGQTDEVQRQLMADYEHSQQGAMEDQIREMITEGQ